MKRCSGRAPCCGSRRPSAEQHGTTEDTLNGMGYFEVLLWTVALALGAALAILWRLMSETVRVWLLVAYGSAVYLKVMFLVPGEISIWVALVVPAPIYLAVVLVASALWSPRRPQVEQ